MVNGRGLDRYDVAYSRELYPPGSACAGLPGTAVNYDESVDVAYNGDLDITVTAPDGGCPGSRCEHAHT